MVLPIPNDYLIRLPDDNIIVYFYKYFNIFSAFVKKKMAPVGWRSTTSDYAIIHLKLLINFH